MRRRMKWIIGGLVLSAGLYLVWKFTARSAYESASYTVVISDGAMEVREYPDLVLATTPMSSESPRGGDGSFGRLFGYISGENEDDRKIAMTVPVFMEQSDEESGRMGFVVPAADVESGVPRPSGDAVEIETRPGGRFAAIRFSGRISAELSERKEAELRDWIRQNGLVGELTADVAGYDPPWLPGPFRRNEVLIRLKQSDSDQSD